MHHYSAYRRSVAKAQDNENHYECVGGQDRGRSCSYHEVESQLHDGLLLLSIAIFNLSILKSCFSGAEGRTT